MNIFREAWATDRKRTIRLGAELLICFLAFIGALVLAGTMGWGW